MSDSSINFIERFIDRVNIIEQQNEKIIELINDNKNNNDIIKQFCQCKIRKIDFQENGLIKTITLKYPYEFCKECRSKY